MKVGVIIALATAGLLAGAAVAIATIGLAIALARPAPKPPRPEPEWLHTEKDGENERPDSPEQVLIILTTNDGKKWVATWEEQR